jgi:dual specificity protein kinase YAK1
LDHLGTGSFGQVVKCIERGKRGGKERQVALKIIKNKPAYHNQGLVEIKILEEVSNSEKKD